MNNHIERGHIQPQTQVNFSRLGFQDAEIGQLKQDMIQGDLAPYTDNDDFLMRRMVGPNRLLRHAPELESQIREAFLASDDESLLELASDLSLARQLYSPEHEKPVGTILSLLNLLEKMNNIRAELDNEDHVIPRINVTFELLYRETANSFAATQLDNAQLAADYISHRAQMWYEEASERNHHQREESIAMKALNNLRIRIGGIYEAIRARNDSYKYVDALPDDIGETVSQQEAEADSRYITDTFRAVRAGQEYGVKMGYIGEEDLGGALLFSPSLAAENFLDNEILQTTYHPLLDKTDAIAQIIHTERKHHRRVKATRTETHGYSTVGFDDLGLAATLTLGPDGELYTWRDCKVSFRDIALQKGKYQAYRKLQATIFAHYFDLTHSLDTVARVTKMLREAPPQPQPDPRSTRAFFERLVVPRVRYSKEPVGPSDDHSSEGSETDQPGRTLRLHGVTWHTRKLPEGWSPSPAALELAEKMGIKLEPGKTFVKEHKRGSAALGEVTIHKLVKRPDLE